MSGISIAIGITVSRSYRTEKESVAAGRRIPRDSDGRPITPRLIERTPAPGDIHPVTKKMLAKVLPDLPVQYLYGLSRIELRARESGIVGNPFGCYWPDERAVILYSLPAVWHLPGVSPQILRSLQKFHASIEPHQLGLSVAWPDEACLTMWFYCEVFAHELGHHFVEQYKNKNSRMRSRRHNEVVADLHASRFTDALFAKHRARKKAAESPNG